MIIILPAIGWAWPALAPIAGAVAGALGYKIFSDPKGIVRGLTSMKLDARRRETVPVDSVLSEIMAEELGNEERMVFEKDDILLIFRKDARGKFFIEVNGPREKTALELKERGEEFALELIKKFAYNRLAEQLARAGATIVEETVEENGRITMKARRWH